MNALSITYVINVYNRNPWILHQQEVSHYARFCYIQTQAQCGKRHFTAKTEKAVKSIFTIFPIHKEQTAKGISRLKVSGYCKESIRAMGACRTDGEAKFAEAVYRATLSVQATIDRL